MTTSEIYVSSFQIALQAQVPVEIADLILGGGPSVEDYSWLRTDTAEVFDEPWWLPRTPPEREEAVACMAKTARIIAILSFCPGGISVFGLHFEGEGRA